MKLTIKHKNGLFYCGAKRWSNLESQAKMYTSFRDLPGYISSNNRDLQLHLDCLDPTSGAYIDMGSYGYLTPSGAPVEVTGVWLI